MKLIRCSCPKCKDILVYLEVKDGQMFVVVTCPEGKPALISEEISQIARFRELKEEP